MRTITKSEFLNYYENDLLYDILVTPIAILAKKKFESGDTPKPKAEVLIVNIT